MNEQKRRGSTYLRHKTRQTEALEAIADALEALVDLELQRRRRALDRLRKLGELSGPEANRL